MSKSILKKAVFAGSLKNEQTLNKLLNEYANKPEAIARKKKQEEAQKIYQSRVLNKEAFSNWVHALRSGNYRQKQWTYTDNYREKLVILKHREKNYFSALGLLCEITKDITGGEWHGEWFVKKGLSFEDWTKDGNSNIIVPDWALEALGVKNIESDLIPSGNINELSEINVYKSFEDIANIIEYEYL